MGLLLFSFGFKPVRVQAADPHVHCVCGGNSEGATAANAHSHADVTWEPFNSSTYYTAGTHYMYLTADYDSSKASLNDNCFLYLCLNGHTFNGNSRAFQTNACTTSGGLTITDCSAGKTGAVIGKSADQGGTIWAVEKATFTLYGGTLRHTGNTTHSLGGAVVYAGKFYMYGGAIEGVQATGGSGGAVSVGTEMKLHGGTISGGTAKNGGNIAVQSSASLTMTGGTVSGGTTTAGSGGNIFANGNVTISGGKILSGSTTNGHGGNICIANAKALSVSGNTEISDGSVNSTSTSTEYLGGNVYIGDGASLTLAGNATVKRGAVNATKGNGGNIRVNGTMTMNGGTVEESLTGENIFVNICTSSLTRKLTINGGTVQNPAGSFNIVINGANTYLNGQFEMTGGKVCRDSSHPGQNISLGGYFKMTGGEICGGVSASGTGGNVSMADATNRSAVSTEADRKKYLPYFEMTGGSVHDGTAKTGGGNVFVAGQGWFVVSGGSFYNGVMSAPDYSVSNVGLGKGSNARISGGYFTSVEGGVDHGIWVDTAATSLEITGGCFTHIYSATLRNFISGGRFYAPTEAYLAPGRRFFEEAGEGDTVTLGGTTYTFGYVTGETVTVDTTSRASTGYLPAVSVSGGGVYRKDGKANLNASVGDGFHFVGWYVNDELVSTSPAYQPTVTGDTTFVAVVAYGRGSGLNVKIQAPAFSYSVNGAAAVSGTVSAEFIAAPSAEVTVTYTGDQPFVSWTNGAGKLIGRAPEYSFSAVNDIELVAGTGAASGVTVSWFNLYRQLLKTETVTSWTESVYASVSVPEVFGKTNGHWNLTFAEAKALIDGGKTGIELRAVYDDDESVTYKVTVKQAEVTSLAALDQWTEFGTAKEGEGVLHGEITTVTADEVSGKKFLCFASADRTILSYASEMPARFAENTTVYAVYGAPDTVVTPEPLVNLVTEKTLSTTGNKSTVYFEALRYLPEEYTLIEQGILFTNSSTLTAAGYPDTKAAADEVLASDLPYKYKYVSTGKERNDVTGLTLKNVPSNEKIYARGYLIYKTPVSEPGIVFAGTEGGLPSELYHGTKHLHSVGTKDEVLSGNGNQVFFEAWTSDNSLPTASGNYYLTKDVTLSNTWNPGASNTINICFNGHVITGDLVRLMTFYSVSGTTNATVSFTDCAGTESAGFYCNSNSGTNQGAAIWIAGSNNTVNWYEGKILGGPNQISTSQFGGLVSVESGNTFNMYGGLIADGKSTGNGANMYAVGTINLYGGTVSNGYTHSNNTRNTYGGNIHLSGGKLNIYDGAVIEKGQAPENVYVAISDDGVAKQGFGGNISATNSAKIHQYGGIVTEGKVNVCGGDVFMSGGASYIMEGGTVSNGSAYSGGGFYMNGSNVVLDIRGGLITGCSFSNGDTASNGGAISYVNGTLKLSGNPVIEGSYSRATLCPGNIFVRGNRSIEVGTLTEGARIFVTTTADTGSPYNFGPANFGTSTVSDQAQYFFSDDAASLSVVQDGTTLKTVDFQSPLKVGFHRADINARYPDGSVIPVPLSGYGKTYERLAVAEVQSDADLTVTCIAVTGNGGTVLMFTVDNVGVPWLSDIKKAVGQATGIVGDRILVTATHTHSAPDCSTSKPTDPGENASELDRRIYQQKLAAYNAITDYKPIYVNGFVEAAVEALADREEVDSMYTGTTITEGLNFVRHYVSNQGFAVGDNFGPVSYDTANYPFTPYQGHVTEADRSLELIQFKRKNGREDVILANFRAHPTLTGGGSRPYISADYVSPFRRNLELATGANVAFFQGAAGNMNASSRISSENVDGISATASDAIRNSYYLKHGKKLAEYAETALIDGTMQEVPLDPTVSVKRDTYEGARKNKDMEEYTPEYLALAQAINDAWIAGIDHNSAGTGYHDLIYSSGYQFHSVYHASKVVSLSKLTESTAKYPLAVLRIGNVAFAQGPYEMFDTNGKAIREYGINTLGYANVFVSGYSNGGMGYVPSEIGFTQQGVGTSTGSYESDQCNLKPIQGYDTQGNPIYAGEALANRFTELLTDIR